MIPSPSPNLSGPLLHPPDERVGVRKSVVGSGEAQDIHNKHIAQQHLHSRILSASMHDASHAVGRAKCAALRSSTPSSEHVSLM